VISVLALFVALGGTGYAAMSLPANSVGAKQLKNSAVTSSKIKNEAVTASKIDAAGLIVPDAAHATNATYLGRHPAEFFAAAALPSGQSESGEWWVGSAPSGGWAGEGVTYPTPLAAPLDSAQVDYVGNGTDSHCPGIGLATAGYLCVYLPYNLDVKLSIAVVNHEGLLGSDAYGFLLALHGLSGNVGPGWGSWTVTAP